MELLQKYVDFIPHLIVISGVILVLLASLWHHHQRELLLSILAQLTLALGLAATIVMFKLSDSALGLTGHPTGSLIVDNLSRIVTIIILSFGWLNVLLARAAFKHKLPGELLALMLMSVAGAMFLTNAYSLLLVFISIELMSLPQYLMAGLNRNPGESSEAAVKYFILGALSSCILLLGSSYLYGACNCIEFGDIKARLQYFPSNNLTLMIGVGLVLISLLFKISAAPFHMWAPDVYQGAHLNTTAFFATVPKVAAISVIIRLTYDVFSSLTDSIQTILLTAGVLSTAVGVFGSLWQNNLKRLIAYSGIYSIGFVLIALGAGDSLGISASLLHLITYNLGIAGLASAISGNFTQDMPEIYDLSGLGNRNKFIAVCLSINLFSLIGLPPLAGFFGKFYIIFTLVSFNQIGWALFVVIMSVIAAYYSLRMLRQIWFEATDPEVGSNDGAAIHKEAMVGFVLLALASLGLILILPHLNQVLNLAYPLK